MPLPQSLAGLFTSQDRARGLDPNTMQPTGPWVPYNAMGRSVPGGAPTAPGLAPLAGDPNSSIGRPMLLVQKKNEYAKAISDGDFDRADAIQREIAALQNPNAIPDNPGFSGGI